MMMHDLPWNECTFRGHHHCFIGVFAWILAIISCGGGCFRLQWQNMAMVAFSEELNDTRRCQESGF
jgi:hypothetical protein